MSSSDTSAKRTLWLVLGLTALGLVLRLAFLGTKCFWQDEGVTYFFARGPIYEDGSPEFYFRVLYLFQVLFGSGEVAGRILSVICGVLFIPLFYLLAERMFGAKAALWSTAILAVSPYAIAVSQEMRMYSLLGLELVIVLYCAWRLLEGAGIGDGLDHNQPRTAGDLKWYLGVLGAGLVGIYTHIIFVFMLAFLSLVFLYYTYRSERRKLFSWCTTMAVMGLAYLPEVFLWTQRAGSRQHILVDRTVPAAIASVKVMARSLSMFLFGLYYKTFKGGVLQFPKILVTILALVLVAGLIWAAASGLWKRTFVPPERRRAAGLMGAFLLFNFMLFLVLEVSSSRHMITMFIPLLLLAGLLLSQLKGLQLGLLAGLLGLFTVISLAQYYSEPYFQYEEADWRTLGKYLQANVGPEDLVFFEGGRNGFYTILYYAPNLSCRKEYIKTKDWPADPYQFEPRSEDRYQPGAFYQDLSGKYRRIWLVVLEGCNGMFERQDQVKPKFEQQFGPMLKVVAI